MQTTLTIKTNKKLRDEAKQVALSLGVPLTTAMNAMLKQFVRDRSLHLVDECPYPSHTPNAETRRAMLDVIEQKNLVSFNSLKEWRASMRSKSFMLARGRIQICLENKSAQLPCAAERESTLQTLAAL